MAKRLQRPIGDILREARRELAMTQKQFGYAVGSSHRSAVRWDAGQAFPAPQHLHAMARLLHAQNRALAAEVADAGGETLESLCLEAPPAAQPSQVQPRPRLEDLVDVVVLAAVEITGSPPAAVRPMLHAVFKRMREMGLTMDAAEMALRPVIAPDDGREAKSKAGKKPGPGE